VTYTASVDHAVSGSALASRCRTARSSAFRLAAPAPASASRRRTTFIRVAQPGGHRDRHHGANYENLVVGSGAAGNPVVTTSPTMRHHHGESRCDPSVAEGGSIVYTASLGNVAQSPVSVTLSNGGVITIAAVPRRQRFRRGSG